jgi:hypothetical protein
VLVNNVFTSVGGCQYELGAGDEVLWIYNAFESRPILGLFAASEHYSSGVRPLTATAQLDQPFEVEVAAYDERGEGQPPAAPERTSKDTEPYEGAMVAPVATSEKGFETVQLKSPEARSTNSEGKASITFTTPGWHRIMAGAPLDVEEEEAAIRSNRLDVCVPAPGETGCGPLPAEDAVRTPPRYQQKSSSAEEHHKEVHTGRGTSGSEPSGNQPEGSSGSASTVKSGRGLIARLASVSVNQARVVLKLTAACKATIKIDRLLGKGYHPHFQTVKTITVKASKAGTLKIRLPRLAAGSYRVSISLAGAKTVIKTLTVPNRPR